MRLDLQNHIDTVTKSVRLDLQNHMDTVPVK